MIVFPIDNLIVKDLNSYYLHIEKFLEHYQGFLAAGGIGFVSPSASGIIYFDEYRFINAGYCDKSENLSGAKAFRKIVQTAHTKNFNVSVFETDIDSIYYWAQIPNAVALYKDLKSEFTDISALISRMKSEKLTGYIEIDCSDRNGSGHIFFNNGLIMASKKFVSPHATSDSSATDNMIKKSAESSGIFHVYQIQMGQKHEEIIFTPSASAKINKPITPKPAPETSSPETKDIQPTTDYLIEMLQQLLQMLEKIIKANKKIKVDFDTLLKKIFVEKVDKYDFLDPFAAELVYENSRLRFHGKTKDSHLVHGVIECALDLASRAGVQGVLTKNLAPWIKKYEGDLNRFNIKF